MHGGDPFGRGDQNNQFGFRDSPLPQHVESQAGGASRSEHWIKDQCDIAGIS